jgi:hypothetical protein
MSNTIKNISNISTQNLESKCLNLSTLGKRETNTCTYKTNTHFDTDKSLINIPRQMITKSNDLEVVNTYSSDSSFVNNSGLNSSKQDESVKQNFTENNFYEEMNIAERNIENME